MPLRPENDSVGGFLPTADLKQALPESDGLGAAGKIAGGVALGAGMLRNLICISIDDRQVLIPRDAEATGELLRWTVGLSPAELMRRMSTSMTDPPHEESAEAVIAVGAYAAAYAITFAAEFADLVHQNADEVVQLLRHGGQLLDLRLQTEPNGVITATVALRPREDIKREAA